MKDEGSDLGPGDLDDDSGGDSDIQRERPNVSKVRRSARNRIKSPVVRIDLNTGGNEDINDDDDDGDGKSSGRVGKNANDTTEEEHIANLPDINNDSMVGDINQLINDLNNGKTSSRGNMKSLQERNEINASFEK